MEINWTVVTYIVIGLFALNGFFRGWWKEAITTGLLVIFIFLLQQPEVAEAFINIVNNLLATIWDTLPENIVLRLSDFFEGQLGISTVSGLPEIHPGDGGAWLIILLLLTTVAILISRSSLPSWGRDVAAYNNYSLTWPGSLFGGLVGALNGMLVIGLVRAYLDGLQLPDSDSLARGVAMAGNQSGGVASRRAYLEATEVPGVTILDSFLPWLFIAIGAFVLIAALTNRIGVKNEEGFRRIEYKAPFGYKKVNRTKKNG